MDAHADRGAWRQAGGLCHLGGEDAQNLGRFAGRGHFGAEAQRFDQWRKARAGGFPQIGMAAQRGDIARHHAGEPPAPIARIGEDMGGAGGQRFVLQKPMQLRADIQPHGQPGRAGGGKTGAQRVIFRCQLIRAGMFIIQHRRSQRPCRIQQHDRGAVGGDADRIHTMFGLKRCQMMQEKGPMPVQIEMRPGRALPHRVGPGDHCNLPQRPSLNQREFRIGLANIQNRDVLHGRWNIGTSGTATGAPSGCVSITSAICAHQRCMTGWLGKSSMV